MVLVLLQHYKEAVLFGSTDRSIMCSLQHLKRCRRDFSINYRATGHKKHWVIYYMVEGGLRVVLWGGGLVGGEVQHMAVLKRRIWEHICLPRMENVCSPQCFITETLALV